ISVQQHLTVERDGARLLATRQISPDRLATCAIAEEFLKRIRTISSVVALELIETRADQHRVRLLFEVQVN
ncbi:MAG: hypothetical protein EOO68_30735, partial [Moraxellaceae bacterium]